MKVLGIKSTTNIIKLKQTYKQRVYDLLERVKCRLSRNYKLKVHNNSIQEIKDSFIKTHPEIVERSNAVKKFMQDNRFASPKINDDIVSCLNVKAEDLLKTCGDDLNKIYNLMGAYGLQLYGSILVLYKDVLERPGDGNLSENGYFGDKKIKLSFDEYLDKNDKGHVSDIYQRFGQCGKTLFERYLMTGCVSNSSKSKVDGTYRTTPEFDLLVRDIDLPVGKAEYIANKAEK